MQSIEYGIVGCGGIGDVHAEAVERNDGVTLRACADLDGEAATAFAEEHDVPSSYDDVATMVSDAGIDAVSVCTPSGTHADATIEAAEAGAHVLCEKPLDVYADRMTAMIDACEDAGVTLAGVFQRRFQPALRHAKEIVESGDIGDVVIGDAGVKWFRSEDYYTQGGWRGTRDLDGGVMLNQAIHSIDSFQWLMGEPETVQASLEWRHRDIECESAAALAMHFDSGAVGTLTATTATRGGRDHIHVNGTHGSIGIQGGAIDFVETAAPDVDPDSAATDSRDVERAHLEWGEGHRLVVQDFLEALREDRPPAVPGEAARRPVDIILAAYAAEARGESIAIEDVRAGKVPEAMSDWNGGD